MIKWCVLFTGAELARAALVVYNAGAGNVIVAVLVGLPPDARMWDGKYFLYVFGLVFVAAVKMGAA